MKNFKYILIVSLLCVVNLTSCKKKKGCTDPISINYDVDATENDGSCTYAGTGGNTDIIATPKRNGVNITGKIGWVDSAFIKFNAIESPGLSPSDYDLIIAGEVGEDHVLIENLKPGKYYLYMSGFDSSIVKRVTGGTGMFITAISGTLEYQVVVKE